MIDSELADLLLKLQTVHQEATQNDAFWTPPWSECAQRYLRGELLIVVETVSAEACGGGRRAVVYVG